MGSRADLFPGAEKVELFLSDLAVNGQVAASTQNQAFGAVESGGLRVEGQRVASDFLNAQPSTLNLPAAGGKRDEEPVGLPVGKSGVWSLKSKVQSPRDKLAFDLPVPTTAAIPGKGSTHSLGHFW